MSTLEVLLIGYGAMAREVAARLAETEGARLAAVLVRPARLAEVRAQVPGGAAVVASLDDLPERPSVVAECAGHGAVRDYGEDVLARGLDLIVISTGALADPELRARLRAAARAGGAKLILPAGAVAGADALAAARVGGLDRVAYTSRKPPKSWRGTPAERLLDLAALTTPTTFFEGGAAEAARDYPQNANVAATVALASAGFDATRVRLVADPSIDRNIHRVEAEGAFGALTVEVVGRTLPGNPKTSALAAYSVVRALRNRAGVAEI